MKKATFWLLALVFAASLALRLYLSFQTPYLTGDGYFAVRQIEAIKHAGSPLYQDPLSFGGSENVFSPGFYYVLSLFSFFMAPEQLVKVIPSIFASFVIIFVFLIAKELVKDEKSALVAAALSAFIPVFFESTLNNGSPYSFSIPLLLFAIYALMKCEQRFYEVSFIAAAILLPLIHPSAVILLLTIAIYFVLIKIEKYKITKNEKVLLLFSFISLAILAVLFFDAIKLHGFGVLTENMPGQMLADFFAKTSLLEAIYKIGFLTVFYGVYAMSKSIDELSKANTIIFSLTLAAAIMLWTKTIELNIGLSILGIALSAIIATKSEELTKYIRHIKFPIYKLGWSATIIFAFLVTALLPSYLSANDMMEKVPSQSEIAVLTWLRDKVPENDVVAAAVEDGDFISGFAGKKNVIDSNFLLKNDSQQRYDDLKMLFETSEETRAFDVLKKYGASYLFISKNVLSEYDIKKPEFYNDKSCFEPIIREDIYLFKITCLK